MGDGVSEQLISQRNNGSQLQGSKHAKTLWFQLKEDISLPNLKLLDR